MDGESQWDFGLFFVEILMKKSARQNGKGNVKRGDGGHPQGASLGWRRLLGNGEAEAHPGAEWSRERC